MNVQELKHAVEQRLADAGLLAVLDRDRSQYLDLMDRVYVELILSDAKREKDVSQALGDLKEGQEFNLHPRWVIETVGEPESARSEFGGIVAARVVGIDLKSGEESTHVDVLITWLAEEQIERISGIPVDFKALARVYVENLLQWGGESYWDPKRNPRLEINSSQALMLYRSLAKAV